MEIRLKNLYLDIDELVLKQSYPINTDIHGSQSGEFDG